MAALTAVKWTPFLTRGRSIMLCSSHEFDGLRWYLSSVFLVTILARVDPIPKARSCRMSISLVPLHPIFRMFSQPFYVPMVQ